MGEVAARQEKPGLIEQLEKVAPQLGRLGIHPDRFVRILLTETRTNRQLLECSPESFLAAAFSSAQLGLEPGKLGHFWLIPKKIKGNWEVVPIIGYRGLVELARRAGVIITPGTVYEKDHYVETQGTHARIDHKPYTGPDDPGAPVRWYAVASFPDGRTTFRSLNRKQVEERRNAGDSANSFAWKKWFDAMARKGLALDTPIPTPSGWSKMGDLVHGDEVFDMHGQVCRVVGISEVKEIDCFEVVCANGDTIICDHEHYWMARVGTNGSRHPWQPYPIGDLYAAKQRGDRVTLPVTGALDTPAIDLPVDPWMLGYWLGNGSAAAARVTCHEDDVDHLCSVIAASGYTVGKIHRDSRSRAATIGIRQLRVWLREAGVLGAKHVPAIYLRGSAAQRLALLQGLVDSDGWVDDRRGRVHFSSTDKHLTDAAAELVRSLGEMPHTTSRETTGYGRTVLSHEVSWMPSATIPVTVPRKADRIRPRRFQPYRGVERIERVATVPTRCIAVDSPSRTYLAGHGMVPTHNTAIRALWAQLPTLPEMADAERIDGQVLHLAGETGHVTVVSTERDSEDSHGEGDGARAVTDASKGEPPAEPTGGGRSGEDAEEGESSSPDTTLADGGADDRQILAIITLQKQRGLDDHDLAELIRDQTDHEADDLDGLLNLLDEPQAAALITHLNGRTDADGGDQ